MHRPIPRVFVAAALLSAIGCSVGTHSSFRKTHPSFTPKPGRIPHVYLYPAEIPDVRLRSVGLIMVSVPAESGIAGATEVAAAAGQRVGCWALVEHSAFSRSRSRRAARHTPSPTALLVHDDRPSRRKFNLPPPSDRSVIKAEFDCVIPVDRARRASADVGTNQHGKSIPRDDQRAR